MDVLHEHNSKLKSSFIYYYLKIIGLGVINVWSNRFFSVNKIRLRTSVVGEKSKDEWKSGKKDKKEQCAQNGEIVKNNAWKPVKDKRNKRSPLEIVDKRSPPATRDKNQSEIADKGPIPATKDEKWPKRVDKRLSLAIKN